MFLYRYCVALVCSLVWASPTWAADEDLNLDGTWYETVNYPASSVLRFERSGNLWVGKYIHVSAQQQRWGFKKGEAVIRGRFEGKVFKGKVLLKLNKEALRGCTNFKPYWTAIEMALTETGKLHGTWLQTTYDTQRNCAVISRQWQVYELERLESD